MKFQDTYDTETGMFHCRQWTDEDELIADETVSLDTFRQYMITRQTTLMYERDPEHDKTCTHFELEQCGLVQFGRTLGP